MECKSSILKVKHLNYKHFRTSQTCYLLNTHFFAFSILTFIFFFLLKYLCESQFDDNIKFKMAINEEDPEKMRLQPIGRDQQGLMYWLQLDQEQNIRLYTEEQDDMDGSSWKCIVR